MSGFGARPLASFSATLLDESRQGTYSTVGRRSFRRQADVRRRILLAASVWSGGLENTDSIRDAAARETSGATWL